MACRLSNQKGPRSLCDAPATFDEVTPLTDPIVLQTVLDSMPDGLLIVDSSGIVLYANPRVSEICGWDPDELVGQSVDVLVPADVAAGHVTQREQFFVAPRNRPMAVEQQLSGRRSDGTLFAVEVSLSPLEVNGEPAVVAIARDVTERAAVQRSLADAERREALLADRERVARDLHDTIIQELFASGMHLQATLPFITGDQASKRVSETIEALDGVIRHVRETIFGLTATTSVEIQRQVENVVRSFDELLAAPAQFTLSGDLNSIPDHHVEQLIPVLREAITNVVKHADADEVAVAVSRDGDLLQLEVRDDGVGFDPEAGTSGRGLRNLRQRAEAAGGHLEVSPIARGGTLLVWQAHLG